MKEQDDKIILIGGQICNLEFIIWKSDFPRDVIKFDFEDYYDSSFGCIDTLLSSFNKRYFSSSFNF